MKGKRYLLHFIALSTVIILYTSLTGCLTRWDCTWEDDMPDFDSLESVEDLVIEAIFTSSVQEAIFGENYRDEEYIVNDDSIYNVWKQNAEDHCLGFCEFPDIDFSTRTLIGKFYDLACSDLPAVKLTKDGNVYTHIVKRINNTQCLQATCINYTFGFVSVPKLDSTATIIFRNGRSRYRCENC